MKVKLGRPKQKPTKLIRAYKEDVKTIRKYEGKTDPEKINNLINGDKQ